MKTGEIMRYFIVLVIFFLSRFVIADQSIVFSTDTPKILKKFDHESFDQVSKLLGSNQLAPHLKCLIKVRQSRDLKKFISEEKWVETLEVEYFPYEFESSNSLKFKIPITAKVGYEQVTNQWSGIGEHIRVELGDHYEHWIEFTHDGQGQIVQLNAGNLLRLLPCRVR